LKSERDVADAVSIRYVELKFDRPTLDVRFLHSKQEEVELLMQGPILVR